MLTIHLFPMKHHIILFLGILTGMFSCTPQNDQPRDVYDFIAGIDASGEEENLPEYRPWTRWWWLGNILDSAEITRELESFSEAGLGGVEITPLYGVKGYEKEFTDHLSPRWQEMLSHTIQEAGRLGMEVDMNLGTGWPFGGPQVEKEYAASIMEISRTPDSLGYVLTCGKTGQKVKRAAPGGEGFSLDHFSREALDDYLQPYDTAITIPGAGLRALFNDSYEVYGANYTPDFPDEFARRRNYDFRDHLPEFIERNDSAIYSRLLCDYRETLSDLILEEFAIPWNSWSNEKGFLTRYQAHGSPGNLLDLYAAAGIPECEIFGAPEFEIPGYNRDSLDIREGDDDPMMQKFCSSAAHLQGNELVSSESFTWLREHFNTALSHCKPVADDLFLNEVTHLFLHGSTYSPAAEPWPGFKFYASVNFHPNNTIWHDAPFLFDYVRRCQYILQQTESTHRVLLYWPFHDVLSRAGSEDLLLQLSVHNVDEWLVNTPFYKLAVQLDSLGIGYDVISDRFLGKTEFSRGRLTIDGKSEYLTILVPDMHCLPITSMEKLLALKKAGARILFTGLPETVPGFYRYKEREAEMKHLIESHHPGLTSGNDIEKELHHAGVLAEKDLKQSSLKFLKKSRNGMTVYFLANHSSKITNRWITFQSGSTSAIFYNPMNGRIGRADSRSKGGASEIRIYMRPGESLFLFLLNRDSIKELGKAAGNSSVWKGNIEPWNYPAKEQPLDIEFGTWKVEFVESGPELPESLSMEQCGPWTGHGDDYDAFAGTAIYSSTFQLDEFDPVSGEIWIELEDVRESARIRVNGEYAGALIAHPFRMDISDHMHNGENRLDIEVTNVSANRIRALERSGREWEKFYDINMVNLHYQPFDASRWKVMPSGLNGGVTFWQVEYE